MELRNPLYPVEFIGGPFDGVKRLLALVESNEILQLDTPENGQRAVYEWREGTFKPYQFVYRNDL